MLLPDNKMKKYIRTVMGVFIVFNIISPIVENRNLLNIEQFDIESYTNKTQSTSSEINQTSMDERIQDLYIQELEKDITKKLNEKGYEVTRCRVSTNILNGKSEITKIRLIIKKEQLIYEEELKKEDNNIENKIVTQIQKIRTIDTNIAKIEVVNDEIKEDIQLTKVDIQNVKKYLMEEYGVNEKCLEIN